MLWDSKTGKLYQKNGLKLNFDKMMWEKINPLPNGLSDISHENAVLELQRSAHKIRIPIGIIGSNKPTEKQYQLAVHVGEELATLGFIVLCGGRAGIMEAACKGVENKKGISIGLLPELDIESANKYVSIPLATGVGFARNAIIASASLCLIAIGGGHGTLSEMAYGLQFNKPVFTLDTDLTVNGAVSCHSVSNLIHNVCQAVLKI